MRKLLLAGVAATALVAVSGGANAEYIFRRFSGFEPYVPAPYPYGYGSGGLLNPADGSEPWIYGEGTPIKNASGVSTTDLGWGSPGVSKGVTPSNEDGSMTDFEITFFPGATIDPAQIALGAASDCAGGEAGGTVFCGANTIGGALVSWPVTFYDASTIIFTGPPGTDLCDGCDYFVNVMLTEGSLQVPFTGAWTFAPEPSSLALLGAGLAGFGIMKRRRRKAA